MNQSIERQSEESRDGDDPCTKPSSYRFGIGRWIVSNWRFGVEIVVVLILSAVASLVMFGPFAPLGMMRNSIPWGDAQQFTFFFAWQHHVFLSGDWTQLYDLPISWPLPKAGGLTDMLPGVAFLSLPLRLFTSNHFLIYNIITLTCGALNCTTMYFLSRDHGAIRPAAFCAGFAFAFSGFFMWHAIGHISVLAFFFAPMAFLTLGRFLRGNGAVWALITGFLFFMQGFCSSRLGIILLVGLIVYTLSFGISPWRKRTFVRLPLLVISLTCGALLVAVIYRPALVVKELLPSEREIYDVIMGSADLAGYMVPNQSDVRDLSWTGELVSQYGVLPNRNENRAFFGWTVYVTLLVGLVFWTISLIRRKRRVVPPEQRFVRWIPLFLVGFLLSLGPYLWIWGELHRITLPYYFVLETVPALKTFRSVARFAMLASIAMSVLFALVLTRIFENSKKRWLAYVVSFMLAFLMVLEFRPKEELPRFVYTIKGPIPQYLEQYAPTEGVIQVPLPGGQYWLLDYIPTFNPTVNTFMGGLHNDWFDYVTQQLRGVPSESSIQLLRQLGISLIIARDDETDRKLAASPLVSRQTDRIYRINGPIKPLEEVREWGTRLEFKGREILEPSQDFRDEAHPALLTFEFNSGDQPWPSSGYEDAEIEKGVMRVTALEDFAYIFIGFDRPVRTSDIASLSLRLKLDDYIKESTSSRLLWRTPDVNFRGELSETVSFRVDGDWQVIRFDLADNPNWTEIKPGITGIRIQLEISSFPGTKYHIDEIRIEGYSEQKP